MKKKMITCITIFIIMSLLSINVFAKSNIFTNTINLIESEENIEASTFHYEKALRDVIKNEEKYGNIDDLYEMIESYNNKLKEANISKSLEIKELEKEVVNFYNDTGLWASFLDLIAAIGVTIYRAIETTPNIIFII